jgi:clusterin-associated protein 1
LQTLRKVRPAFMDEYEKLEGDFKRLYEEYITRFRCLAYLEQQLEDYERTEQLRVEERQQAAQKLLDKLRQEEEKRLQGYNDVDDDDDDDDDEDREYLNVRFPFIFGIVPMILNAYAIFSLSHMVFFITFIF